jgi:formate hydrogenlyase transcriptional activator
MIIPSTVDISHDDLLTISREYGRLVSVHEVSTAVASELTLHQLIAAVSKSIKTLTGAEYADLLLGDPTQDRFWRPAVSFEMHDGCIREDWVQPMDDSPALIAFRTKKAFVATREMLERDGRLFKQIAQLISEGIQEFCCVPLISRGKVLGTMNVGSLECSRFTPDNIRLLQDIAKPIAMAVENALTYDEVTRLKDKLAQEKSYLEGEFKGDCNFEEILGESKSLKAVLDEVRVVSASDATVLILGETGTGKELVARAVHNLSDRKDRTFVKLNCAAVPTGLLESELFGHERGAFTSAVGSKMGLMEVAHKGTLFLDEVGDIPLELQPKLLRVLQEGEFSRLGSTRTVKVDVRLIAATNCNLHQMVAERRFRSDLFYRLNVFPLTIPPLRERREDIALLVKHFTRKFARRRNRTIDSIPSESMDALVRWNWPGNVRELENLIERAVLLSYGAVLNVPLKELQNYQECSVPPVLRQERDFGGITPDLIIRTLRETNGIVSGPRGAAKRLGLKRTTLLWRMNSLGISPKQILP